jgi:hypothetical protein
MIATVEWSGPGDAPTPPDLDDPGKRIDMANRTCSVDGCDRKHAARGMCHKHWKRWAYNNPDFERTKRRTIEARFWEKVDKTDTCWLWTGSSDRLGYGRFSTWPSVTLAHRFAYELLAGPIPDGLVIDHLCRTPSCVNPDHLEPVTQRENLRRGARHGLPKDGA